MERKKMILICQAGNASRIEVLKEQLTQKGYTVRYVCVPSVDPNDVAKEEEIKALLENETKDVDILICLIDETTHENPLIDWEIERAYQEELTIVGMYAEECSVDVALPENLERYRDQLITWTEEKIVEILENQVILSERPDGTPKEATWTIDKKSC